MLKSRIEAFNLVYFEPSEYFDYIQDIFDFYVINGCNHFLEIEDAGLSGEGNVYVDVMREIQSASAAIFFLLVHIPLSRVNSLFCLITGSIPMMLNIKTKYWFYELTNKFVCMFFRQDKEAINYV